ncbi:MAG: LacI family DNA-binding transcriptional regulator [Luteitalea sp.]|nr:LacI family DNA-binding transcriptional regulator [Luteitalea sp.]
MRLPTIKDVARRAGVSTATVSRVLNDSGYFDPETGRAVQTAVAALGYRRNIHWKRLARNASDTICFLLGNRESLNSMQVRMLVAAERVLAEAGYDLVFAPCRYGPNTPVSRLPLPRIIAQQGSVDGLILAGVHHGNFLAALRHIKLRYVILGNTFIGPKEAIKKDAVVYDDIAGVDDAVQYLIRLGHRRVAFVGNTDLPWFRRRFNGYRRALSRAGLESQTVAESWQVSHIEYGRLAAAELLRRDQPPTAIVAANDEVAGGVWKTLVSRGIAIPRDISLVGFGDREEVSMLEPSLTTVSVFQDKLGAEMARMLMQKLARPSLRLPSRTFPCQLLERNSCAPPAAGLRLVATDR